MAGAAAPDGSAYREERESRRADAGLVGRFVLPSGLLAAVRAAATSEWHEHRFGADAYDDRHATWLGEATLGGQAAAHRWLVGAAVQEERYRSRDLPRLDYVYRAPALFAQDVYAPAEWLTLSVSARLDFHSASGTFLSPRVSALVRPAGGWAVRASAGLGFAAPTPLIERTEEAGLGRVAALGDLDAERARSASLDVERTVGALELSASLFGTEIDHALLLLETPDTAGRLPLVNAATPTQAYGLEVRARYQRGPVYVLASHTYLRSREEAPEGGRRETPLTPRHVFMVDAVVEPDDEMQIGLEGAYVGRQPLEADDPYRRTSRPHVLLGILAIREIGPVKAFLNLENLLNVRQTKWAPLVRPGRAPDGRWTTDVWAPLEGRTVNGGLRIAL